MRRIVVVRGSLCWRLSTILTALLAGGCGSDRPVVLPVSGVVTLEGKPVADAAVVLTSKNGGRPASGQSDNEGRFKLTTFDLNDGAVPGEHVAVVVKKQLIVNGVAPVQNEDRERNSVSTPTLGYNTTVKWLVPPKYADPTTSGLIFSVESGMEPLKLELFE